MRFLDIVRKKRDAEPLTTGEISFFVKSYTAGDIPDYQVAAFLMAVYLRGMTRSETVDLTLAMAHSGQMMDLSDIASYAVDKHSSGGVGDKTSLVVLPLVASCGVPVAKMSGRGLGFSGGTLDKMEAIRGFDVNLTEDEFRQQAQSIGIVLCGQTGELAPADGKLYALRDVTETVSSIPLIAASIMSKKLAAGANGIVLDVKCGLGAFMQTLENARELAQIMVKIGQDAGRDVIALISDMNQPLGHTIGNALEVREAIDMLQGKTVASDFYEHCIEVALYMLQLYGRGEKWTDADAVREYLVSQIENGSALAKFRELVEAQGGDVSMVDHPEKLPQATLVEPFMASEAGYVHQVNALQVARASLALGAGREQKGDQIDLAVGLEVFVKAGDQVEAGQVIAQIHANDADKLNDARELLQEAIVIGADVADPLPLFYDVIDGRELD